LSCSSKIIEEVDSSQQTPGAPSVNG
jgi:hypothetical protein